MLAEQADEVVLVAEAQGVGHFFHRLVGGEEQQLCPLHLLLINILYGREAELALEQLNEVRLGDTGHVGQLLHLDAIADVGMDML